ncbi:hypothetical protein BGZ80_006878, partial [Entomortierella chlamydospora]
AEDDDLLPSTQGHEFVFQGNFGDVELGASFTAYHYACIKQQVPITRVQDVLCRSGILYLGSLSQTFRKFFGQDTVDQIVQCFTERYWPRDLDVKEDRRQVQEWFNFLEDEANLTEASDLILKAGSNPRNRKLWLYILNAMERLAQSQTSTNKSEATVMTRYVVPLLEVFLNKPQNNVILDTPNTIAKVVQHRKQLKDEKQGKRPDVRLSAVDINGDMVIEIGHGEIKSGKHDKGGAAVSRDLVRVGLFMKDQLDAADDTYGVSNSLSLGMQFNGCKALFFLMSKCRNFYIMMQVATMTIPDSIATLSKVSSEYKLWRQLEKAVVDGYQPLIDAIRKGRSGVLKEHFPTTTSPDLNKIKTKY